MYGLWWISWAKYIHTTIESKACGVYKNFMFGELKTDESLDFNKKEVINNKIAYTWSNKKDFNSAI